MVFSVLNIPTVAFAEEDHQHTFGNWIVSVAETCEKAGSEYRICTGCSYQETRTLSALGHNYVKRTIPANCLNAGYDEYVCGRCNKSYRENITKAIGHRYTETTVYPTCTTKGYVLHSCVMCSYSYMTDEVQPLGHHYISNIVTHSTCTTDGKRHHKCQNCGDEYDTVIKSFGHSYVLVSEKEVNKKTIRIYKCSKCNASYEENLDNQYEKVGAYLDFLFDKYSPYLSIALGTTAGVWSIFMGVSYIIAARNEDREKSKRTIINYLVGLIVIFIILVACPYLIKGISYLIK